MGTSDDAEYCRRKAEECQKRAEAAATEDERQRWLELAGIWLSRVEPRTNN